MIGFDVLLLIGLTKLSVYDRERSAEKLRDEIGCAACRSPTMIGNVSPLIRGPESSLKRRHPNSTTCLVELFLNPAIQPITAPLIRVSESIVARMASGARPPSASRRVVSTPVRLEAAAGPQYGRRP